MKYLSTLFLTLTMVSVSFSQETAITLINSAIIGHPAQVSPPSTLVNPEFTKLYHIKSIALKFHKGNITLKDAQPNFTPQLLSHQLFFNVSGLLTKELFLKKNEHKVDTNTLLYGYDLWNKLEFIEEREEELLSTTKHFSYKEKTLQEITETNANNQVENTVRLHWNGHQSLSRREEFIQGEKLQTEYFLKGEQQENVVEFIKKKELNEAQTPILSLYILKNQKVYKELIYTPYSEYMKRYTYDAQERIIAINQREYGKMVSQVFKYDKKGNLIERVQSTTGLPTIKTAYVYDKQGVFLNEIIRKVDGEVTDVTELAYSFRF